MKRLLIVVLAVLSLSANADSWVMANNGGGQVVLTDRLCKGYKHVYYAYTHTPRFYMDACWALMDGKVHVVYENGERRVYEMNDFVQDQVTPKKKGQQL